MSAAATRGAPSELSTLGSARLVLRRDLAAEWRSRILLVHVVPFAAVTLMMFVFALDSEPRMLSRAASGLYWVSVLFASILITQRTFAAETAPGVADAYRLSRIRPSGVFVGKTSAMVIELAALQAVMMGLMSIWFRPGWNDWPMLLAAGVTTTIGIAAASCVYGLLGSSGRTSGTTMPILVLPALAPLLLGASQSFDAAASREGGGWAWIGLLAVFAVGFGALGAFVYGPLMEDA